MATEGKKLVKSHSGYRMVPVDDTLTSPFTLREPRWIPDNQDVHIRKWEVNDSAEKCGFDESDGPEDVEGFLITLDVAVKLVPVAYKTCFSVVTSTVENSDVLWLQNHCKFVTNIDAGHRCSIGYGFGVFTLEALTVLERNITETFSENGNHPLVELVANKMLKSAFRKNKRLVASYIESVLVKEAFSMVSKRQLDVVIKRQQRLCNKRRQKVFSRHIAWQQLTAGPVVKRPSG